MMNVAAAKIDPATRRTHTAAVVVQSLVEIRKRYEDTSVVIHKERRQQPRGFRSSSSSAVRPSVAGHLTNETSFLSYGNSARVIQRRGNNVTKADEKSIESKVCAVM